MGLREQFSKWKNVRIVKFNKDFQRANGRVIYAKGSTHYIHDKIVKQLKLDNFADVKIYDYERGMQKAADVKSKAKEKAKSA